MRHVLVACLALLAVAASPRGGCGKAPHEPCGGKPCGAACTVCAPDDSGCVETAVVKACDAAGECVPATGATCPAPSPCAGKACGVSCNPCGDASPCPTFAATVCDGAGECVNAATVTCLASPCAGKRCGDDCTIDPPCRQATPPCMLPSVLGRCDAVGACVVAVPVCAPSFDPCAGKACHEACNPCAPNDGPCMATICATWCDGVGRCVCAGGGAACP